MIPPGVLHRVDPSTDARFFAQFHWEPDAPLVRTCSPNRRRRRTSGSMMASSTGRRSIGSVTDLWNHVLLYAPDHPIGMAWAMAPSRARGVATTGLSRHDDGPWTEPSS